MSGYPPISLNAHSNQGTNPSVPFASGAFVSLNNTGEAQSMFFDVAKHWSFTPRVYEPHQHFCYQKFEVTPEVDSTLDLTNLKTYVFKINPMLDVLVGYYLCFNLPDIYSPIYHPCQDTNQFWSPYEFKWIDDFCEIIEEYEITVADRTIFRGDGKSLRLFMNRDLSDSKLKQFNDLVGAVPEISDPASAHRRFGTYPNVMFSTQYELTGTTPAPSIPGRMIMVPLHVFFHPCGFPMHLLQKNLPLVLRVTLRPVADWFRIRDVFDHYNDFPRVRPEFNEPQFQLYRFLQPPPSIDLSSSSYTYKPAAWEANLHLITEFVALTEEERNHARRKEDKNVMLFRNITRHVFRDIQGYFEAKINNPTQGFVTSLIIAPQRGDVARRNEWSNYTNWPYLNELPSNIMTAPTTTNDFDLPWKNTLPPLNLHLNNNTPTGICVTGPATADNEKYIIVTSGLLYDGNEREKILPYDVVRRLDIMNKCPGPGTDGVAYYQYSKFSSPAMQMNQPAGIQNWGNWNRISIVGNTLVPTVNPQTNIQQQFLCNEKGDNVISVSFNNYTIYDYKYTLYVYEERLNMILFDTAMGIPNLLYVP